VTGPLDFAPGSPAEEPEPTVARPLDFAPGSPAEEPERHVAAPPVPPPARPPGASRYGWFVGVVAVLLIAYASVHAVRSSPGRTHGLRAGSALPPFSAPLATSTLDGDVNVARRAGAGSAGNVPACSIHQPDVLNVCDAARRGPLVLAFLATGSDDCVAPLDEMERLGGRFPGVQLAAVAIRGNRGKLRALVRGHGWSFPVAYDRDGALANLYGVAVCPQLTYAYPGGVVAATTFGALGQRELDRRLRALVAGSRKRGWAPPAT
jgi:hypothetical protein